MATQSDSMVCKVKSGPSQLTNGSFSAGGVGLTETVAPVGDGAMGALAVAPQNL
jgi:hypothetical protein